MEEIYLHNVIMITKSEIEKYFLTEKQIGLLFLLIGIIAIVAALIFIFLIKNNFWRGAAMPFLFFGVLQIVVGTIIYSRSDADRTRVVYAYDMNPQEIKNKELPRMQNVNKTFTIYKWIEITFLIVGIILIVILKIIFALKIAGMEMHFGLALVYF